MIALKELDRQFEFVHLDIMDGDQFTDGFGALTPNRKVPVIIDDEVLDGNPLTLWESAAILIHLAEHADRLLPSDPHDRIIAVQWLMFQVASVGPMFGQHAHFKLYAASPEHAYSQARYASEVRRIFDVLEARLNEARFLGGSEYSIADIATWSWCRNPDWFGVNIGDLPAVERWRYEIGARPAVMEATRFFDELAARIDVNKMLKNDPDKVDRYLGRGKYSRV